MTRNAQAPVVAPAHIGLTDDELRAVAYFAVGVGSEGSVAGDDRSRELSFAGNFRNGRMYPVGNSGLSIGTLQTDLGAHPEVARQLVDSYQAWATRERPEWVLTANQRTALVRDLGRDGNQIRADDNRAPDATQMSRINAYLATAHGNDYVHARDVAQVNRIVASVGPQLQTNTLYAASSADDQVRLAAIVLKIENQTGSARTMLRNMDNGTHRSLADVNAAVDRMVGVADDYMETGRDHTLAASEVIIGLRNASQAHPLRPAWESMLADPLVNPRLLDQDARHPNLPSEYGAIKHLALQAEHAPGFLSALERGGAYAWGRPQAEGRQRPTAGLYAMGDDLVLWDVQGAGVARIGGDWRSIDRNDLTRTRHPDRSVDLFQTEGGHAQLLLRVDPALPPLRPPAPAQREAPRPAGAQPHAAASMAEHPLFVEARRGVHRLDETLGRTYDENSDRMACRLAGLARENGMDRIDHVILSQKTSTAEAGENVFIVQGDLNDPGKRLAHMKTHDALATPVEQSVSQFHGLSTSAAAPAMAASIEQSQEVAGPRMRV